MKEASGEFSMTLVVIVAAIAIIGILGSLKDPMKNWIENKWHALDENKMNS